MATAGQLGMQPGPGGHLHAAALLIVDLQGLLRGRPAGRVGAAEPRAVPARPAQLTGGPSRRIGVEDPVAADAGQHRHRQVGQVHGERDRVVAGVEDEQRCCAPDVEPAGQRADLRGGGGSQVLAEWHARGIDLRGPGVPGDVEPSDPGAAPAGRLGRQHVDQLEQRIAAPTQASVQPAAEVPQASRVVLI
ncbi:MAG TPA: hypothetical protein VE823_07785 [Geodermatophilus sp.]|nr:hypothetical protein [Geodermatophilus sp.]